VNEEEPVLEIRDLRVTFPTESGDVQAVRGVDVTVGAGELLGVVGESGSGKSVTFLAAMGLLPKSARIEGSVKVHGKQLVGVNNREMRDQRGKRISMIFQDPLSALNPTHKIGHQVAEMIRSHNEISKSAALTRAVELLDIVGIPQPRTRAMQYPHEFSGGMRQRVMIAIAIANDPDVLIADEPTTALDVTVQAQILDVIQRIQHNFRAGVVFITHDLGVVARIADRVQVMYAGRTVERGDVNSIFRTPTHLSRARRPTCCGRRRVARSGPDAPSPPRCAQATSPSCIRSSVSRPPASEPRNCWSSKGRRERVERRSQRGTIRVGAGSSGHRSRQGVPHSTAAGDPRRPQPRAGRVEGQFHDRARHHTRPGGGERLRKVHRGSLRASTAHAD
jgi:ABC-type dipeptide/oligopeptide/nickel transport system ATPase component